MRSVTLPTGDLNHRVTLHQMGIYPGDPTHRWHQAGFSKAARTPDGAAVGRLDWTTEGQVEVTAWGDGADWVIDHAPAWLGLDDDLDDFGPWTATATLTITHGDPDLVMLGDYGMPTLVNWFFTGDATRLPPEPDGDRVMLDHLAPWAGHRQRIMKLLFASDVRVPRRAPRAKNPDIRRM